MFSFRCKHFNIHNIAINISVGKSLFVNRFQLENRQDYSNIQILNLDGQKTWFRRK